jgi:hypothetical protein
MAARTAEGNNIFFIINVHPIELFELHASPHNKFALALAPSPSHTQQEKLPLKIIEFLGDMEVYTQNCGAQH